MKKAISFSLSAACLLCLPVLQGCGFHPLYSTKNAYTAQSVQTLLADTRVNPIPDREGQFLYNKLLDRFYRHGYPAHPRYALSISKISESQVSLGISKNDNTTRAQMRLDTRLSLIDLATQDVLLTHPLRSVTSYNVLSSEFSTRVSEQAARENALNDLALQIETQLALYFERENL